MFDDFQAVFPEKSMYEVLDVNYKKENYSVKVVDVILSLF